jgi:hypothetical protein
VLAAAVPATILSTLHAREYVSFREKGSKQWNRQLRTWRRKDAMLWVLMTSLSLFYVFFLCVFLANVSEKSGMKWLYAVALGVAKKILIIPLIFAIILIIITTMTLSSSRVKAMVKEHHAIGSSGQAEGEEVRFLPKTLMGEPVLIPQGGFMYLVDNTRLKSDRPGIAYCFSKNLNHKDISQLAPWDDRVEGRDDGDWVKVLLTTIEQGNGYTTDEGDGELYYAI